MLWWARKLYRLVMGSLFPLIYFIWPSRIPVLSVLLFFFLWALAGEITRRKYPRVWKAILRTKLFGAIFKSKAGMLLGSTYFLLACIIVVAAFPRSISLTSMAYLVLGDAASTLVGQRYGSIELFSGKSFQGTLAFLTICCLVGWLLHFPLGLSVSQFLAGAVAAAFIELLPLPLDDNFTIALFSSLVMRLIA